MFTEHLTEKQIEHYLESNDDSGRTEEAQSNKEQGRGSGSVKSPPPKDPSDMPGRTPCWFNDSTLLPLPNPTHPNPNPISLPTS